MNYKYSFSPDSSYWVASPHTPIGDRKKHNDPTCGDSHCWHVWFGLEPFENQRKWTHRFISEFGFQSFPGKSYNCIIITYSLELKTLKSFTMESERNITSYIVDYHQRSPNGNRKLFSFLLDWLRLPNGLEETLIATQVTSIYQR